jgi:hypothetical protein
MNPFNGTWIANISKSQRHANHQFHSAKLHFEVSDDNVSLRHEGINAEGKYESGTTTLSADGKEHDSSEAPGIKILTQFVGDHLIDSKAFKDGQLVGHGTYEVSKDGSTLTATVYGTDASGKPFEQIIIFDHE